MTSPLRLYARVETVIELTSATKSWLVYICAAGGLVVGSAGELSQASVYPRVGDSRQSPNPRIEKQGLLQVSHEVESKIQSFSVVIDSECLQYLSISYSLLSSATCYAPF